MFKARKLIEVERRTLVLLLRTQPYIFDFPSADLSTPRGALEYLRDFCIKASNKGSQARWLFSYGHFVEQVGSGQLSPESVEKIHEMAKKASETLHTAYLLFQNRELSIIEILQIVAGVLGTHSTLIEEVIHNDSHTMETIRKKSSDNCDDVE